ncbi:hypothetical protein P9112_005603 [Eukaryota sp. TZLM1-RC]
MTSNNTVFYEFIDSSKAKQPPLCPRTCKVKLSMFEPLVPFPDLIDSSTMKLVCTFNKHNRCWSTEVAEQSCHLHGQLSFNYMHSIYPPGDLVHLKLVNVRKKQTLSRFKHRIIATASLSLVHAVQQAFSGCVVLKSLDESTPFAKVFLSLTSLPYKVSSTISPKKVNPDLANSDTESEKEPEPVTPTVDHSVYHHHRQSSLLPQLTGSPLESMGR